MAAAAACGLCLLCQLPRYCCERDCLSLQAPSWALLLKQSRRISVSVSRLVHFIAFAVTNYNMMGKVATCPVLQSVAKLICIPVTSALLATVALGHCHLRA